MLQAGSLTKTVLSGTNISWLLLRNEDKPVIKWQKIIKKNCFYNYIFHLFYNIYASRNISSTVA